jgi:diguanylate cyclase (GGDEF)-like protein
MLALASGICGLLLSGVLAITRSQAPQIRGSREWLVGAILGSIGIALNGAQSVAPVPSIILSSGLMICLGVGFIWLGCRIHRGAQSGLPVVFLVSGTYLVLAFAFTIISYQVGLRQLSFSVACSFFAILAVIELLGDGPSGALRARRIAAAAISLLALLFLVRSIVALSGNAQEVVAPSPLNLATYAIGGGVHLTVLLAINALMTSNLVSELKRYSDTDYLTGVMNRQGFMRAAGPWLAEHGGERLFAMRIDLDNLRQFNDAGGHELGDQMLRVAARSALSHLPPQALLARWGGDEFMAFIPGVATAQRFEVEYPLAFTVAARSLSAFAATGTPVSRMQPGVSLRKSEFQGSVKETFGLTTFPPASAPAAPRGR